MLHANLLVNPLLEREKLTELSLRNLNLVSDMIYKHLRTYTQTRHQRNDKPIV